MLFNVPKPIFWMRLFWEKRDFLGMRWKTWKICVKKLNNQEKGLKNIPVYGIITASL